MSAPDFLTSLRTSAITRRIARGSAWLIAGMMLSRALTLLSVTLVARILGITQFGEFGIIQSTVGMFQVFAGFGLGITATKHVAEFRDADPSRAGSTIVLSNRFAAVTGIIASLALAALAPWLATHMLAAPSLGHLLRLSAVLLFLAAVNGSQIGALSGFEDFKAIAWVNVGVGLFSFPALLYGVHADGLRGAVLALIATSLLKCIWSHYAISAAANKADVPLEASGVRDGLAVLWTFTVPTVLAGALVGPVMWICTALLVNQPNGYFEMGIFNAVNQWYVALLFLPALIGQVIMPVMAERISVEGANRSVRVMWGAMLGLGGVFLLITMAGGVLSPLIMRSYGPSFNSHWPTLVIAFATAFLVAIETPVGSFIAASGRMWAGFALNAGWALAQIILGLWLVREGAFGLVLAGLLAYGIHGLATFSYAYCITRAGRSGSLPLGVPAEL